MANRPRRGRALLNIGVQAARLKNSYPQGDTVLRGRLLTWKGTLTPSLLSQTYEVVVVLEEDFKPLVYVVSPPWRYYQDKPLPHVYPHQTLCLFLDNEWGPWAALADTILPWTTEWLFFYEAWTVTGEWIGGGVHPAPSRTSRSRSDATGVSRRPRRVRSSRDERLDRLTAGLRQAYGAAVDLNLLLANTRCARPCQTAQGKYTVDEREGN